MIKKLQILCSSSHLIGKGRVEGVERWLRHYSDLIEVGLDHLEIENALAHFHVNILSEKSEHPSPPNPIWFVQGVQNAILPLWSLIISRYEVVMWNWHII